MQINLSMENCWGIVRALVDVVAAMDDGRYLLVKCVACLSRVCRSFFCRKGMAAYHWPPLCRLSIQMRCEACFLETHDQSHVLMHHSLMPTALWSYAVAHSVHTLCCTFC